MVKKWILAVMLVATFVMTGCDLFGTDEESGGSDLSAANIAKSSFDLSMGPDTLKGAGTITTTGAIVSVTAIVKDNAGATVANVPWVIAAPAAGAMSYDLAGASFAFGAGDTPTGTYHLNFIVTYAGDAGNVTDTTGMIMFTVTANATALTSSEVTLGAQAAVPGSYLDVDMMTLYTSSTAPAASASIDLVVGSLLSGGVSMMSPADAAGTFTPVAAWSTKNATMFHTVSVTYTSIQFQFEIDALWVDASGVQRASIGTGGVYVIKTSDGKVGLIEVGAPSVESPAATVRVKGLK